MATPITFQVFLGETLVGSREFQQDVIKIGRLATAHLKLEDTRVSRIHAVVEVLGGGRDIFITDMGSAEGTFVNGEKVNKVKLKDGDTVVLGDTRLVVSVAGAARAAPAPAPLAAVEAAPPPPVAAPAPSPVISAPRAAPVAAFVPASASVSAPRLAPAAAPAPVAAAPRPAVVSAPVATLVRPAAPAPAPVAYEDEEPLEEEEMLDAEPLGPMETEPEPVPDATRAVLEVQVRWGNTVIEVQHHPHTPKVTLGPGGHIHLNANELAAPRPLFTCNGKQYALIIPPGFKGFIRTPADGIKPLEELKGERTEFGQRITLSPEESGELTYHDLVLAFRFNEPRPRVIPAIFGAVDYGWMNTFMSTVFLSAAFIATLVLYPQDTKSLEEDLIQTNNRFTQFIVNPEKKKKSEFLQKLEKSKNDQPQVANKNNSNSSKKPDVAVNKQAPPKPTKEQIRAANEEKVQKKIAALFGGGGSADVFSGANNNTLAEAMGEVSSRNVASAFGMGGLGERGHGPGGGSGTGTFGVGGIGTRGRGGGNSGFGSAGGGLGGKTERSIDISNGAPVILGSLDKEIIRRVIKDNLAQIKYCYERELTTNAGLSGKIQVKFVIGAQGAVQSAVVAETSMNNKNVEGCITNKVRSWVFPKPKGGGIVIVTYPFIFKQGG